MKTSFDIIGRLYKILNVTDVTNLATGGIWRRQAPISVAEKYITVNVIPRKSETEYPLQEGVVIINIYAKDHPDSTPDETLLKTIGDAIVSQISTHNETSEYFTLSIVSDNVYPDDKNPGVSYVSIRINYTIER